MEKSILPILVLKDIVLLPNNEMRLEFVTEEDKSLISLAESFYNKHILIINQKDDLDIEENYPIIGVIGYISMKLDMPNKKTRIVINGLKRAKVSKTYVENDILVGELTSIEEELEYIEESAYKRSIFNSLEKFLNENEDYVNNVSQRINKTLKVSEITDILAAELNLPFERELAYLEETDISNRALMVLDDLSNESKILELEQQIEEKVSHNIDEAQKEYFLNERIKVMQKELGQDEYSEIEELKNRVSKIKCPKKVKDKLYNEIKKYEKTPSNSPDYSMIKTYIDTVLSLPWSYKTADNDDLEDALHILNDSHYGLDDVKKRIIEYLALTKMTNKNNIPIICLVGPPGVGKTTLAINIANAMKRKHAKITVGGVNDPADIIGHRRTYIGSSPGRIIEGMKKAGSINPVFIIDEIDKMTKDIKGDPASSLLEVLDKSQNKSFVDNYIEEEYDLSNVLFICTANYKEQIPPELLDRLEIIELSSYTVYEKLNICKSHIIPKMLKDYNLEKYNIKFYDDTIINIINCYTKEAGVRELERLIGNILRKIVKDIVSRKESIKYDIEVKDLTYYLSLPKYNYYLNNKEYKSGEVNAMSYTPFGGDILKLEVNILKGNGNIITTGSLGEVFKESCSVAISYIKANCKEFGIDYKKIAESDIHLHVPEGAVKKDGPSAGCAITTAIISSIKNTPISNKISMTGEITIHGDVLEIGGLKEKIIGAKRSKVEKIFIPSANKNDLEEIDDEVKQGIRFILVDNYMEIAKELGL